ncbi:ribonucleases P/MRP protein subunit POP1-domain-containing protein [Dendryphion nanum]|uniref:SAGA-associated factor 11 n=1 Tax=Dendryphion nanum TaxID=256645 RepID=A0A9P9IK82_9PLEO|nr:ribonucleases P/MRP protein subunit POP1-domain-containing protein [Dendryphion nanum]
MADSISKKRKQNTNEDSAPKRPRFPLRQKPTMNTTRTTTAYPNGELNVSRFMRAHENEIKSLEAAMSAAKKGLSRRAFQDVPRSMRRRTASHNPQRVPHRLRQQARREAKEDNTPVSKNKSGSGIGKSDKQKHLRKEGIEKARRAREKRERREAKAESSVTVTMEAIKSNNTTEGTLKSQISQKYSDGKEKKRKRMTVLSIAPTPPSKFRRRQIHKTWLPTHVWHAKRALMTPPNEPLWRFAIPLAPAVKSYRLTHRAASLRGAVAWDTSYIGTINLEGVEASISGLLKSVHFSEEDNDDPWATGRRGKRWRDGVRAWDGWMYEREGRHPKKKIAWTTVIWSSKEEANGKRRAFVRVHPGAFMQLWSELIKASKIQTPAVIVEDLRFEVGSIEIMGPAAAETLCSILHPSTFGTESSKLHSSTLAKICAVASPAMLAPGALLAFPITDPRLRDPPSSTNVPQNMEDELTEILAHWPVDNTTAPADIFDRDIRKAADRILPSQQSINRRKGAADPGQYPEARSTDPYIPMLTYVSRTSNSWTVLLPWKSVLPVWRGVMRYPVSTGENPRFGGIKERRQVSYERSIPTFPFDYPGTDAGWAWELHARTERQHDWTRRPKGKRIEWTTIDLGNGKKGEVGDPWSCDWEKLLSKRQGMRSAPSIKDEHTITTPLRQLSSRDATKLIARPIVPTEQFVMPHIFTVKINMVQRGVPADCARIYRLPIVNTGLRRKWLALQSMMISGVSKGVGEDVKFANKRQQLSKDSRTKALAANLLKSTQSSRRGLNVGDADYPVVPDEEDLIGFVTTGNYNLSEGRPTAIASLVMQMVLQESNPKERQICIVREAGQTFGRMATWTIFMSEDKAADGQADGVGTAEGLTLDALADLTAEILEDSLYNIVFRTAMSSHRAEKALRMQSAATQAESIALSNLEPAAQVKGLNSQTTVPSAETSAAKYDNGQVYLKGNPLKTTPEIVCPHCKLPRLMHPIMGKGMQAPDLTREYCKLYPFVQQQGHDVYGNPFPTDMAKSKKERELIKQQQKNAEKESVGTPNSQDTDMAGGDAQNKEIKLNTGGKPASYVPWHTCPSCKRSLLITRFAQHLEKCLGISGRQSSRNAMAKLAGHNGNGSGAGNTPLGSRMGTPVPGSQGDPVAKIKGKGISPVKKLGDDDDDGGENDTPERKKKKKSNYVKKADRLGKEGGAAGSLKVKLKTNSSKDNLKDLDRKQRDGSERSEKPEKREREDNEDGAPKAKKIKLSLGKNDARSPPTPVSAEVGG